MPFTADVELSKNDDYRARLRAGMVKVAGAIQGEALNTPNHTKRSELATNVLTLTDQWVPRFALPACVGDALTLASTDAEIETRVASIWNWFFVTPSP